MSDNQSTVPPENNAEPTLYSANTENAGVSPNPQPSNEMLRRANSGTVPSETVPPESWPPKYEPALRQAMDAGIDSLRNHVDDCINSVNIRLTSIDELFKSKLETVDAKMNGEINLLKSNIQTLMEERKTKKERKWNTWVIVISSLISLLAGAGITIWVTKWLTK